MPKQHTSKAHAAKTPTNKTSKEKTLKRAYAEENVEGMNAKGAYAGGGGRIPKAVPKRPKCQSAKRGRMILPPSNPECQGHMQDPRRRAEDHGAVRELARLSCPTAYTTVLLIGIRQCAQPTRHKLYAAKLGAIALCYLALPEVSNIRLVLH